MKVLPVSLQSFRSQNKTDKYDLKYLYTLPEQKNDKYVKQYYIAMTMFTALTAVGITLFNVSGHRRFPYSIAELSDMSKGLNKITDNDKLVNSLKTDFIYPIKSFMLGDKKIKESKEFKTGFIMTGQDDNTLKNISDALTEHFEELGIRTVSIPHTVSKVRNGEVVESKHTKSKLYKILKKEIEINAELYKKDGKFTVINIGNIDDLTDLKVVKSQISNFEELLKNLSNDTENQGIIWIGRTNKQKAIPLFLSYLPVIIKKTEQIV